MGLTKDITGILLEDVCHDVRTDVKEARVKSKGSSFLITGRCTNGYDVDNSHGNHWVFVVRPKTAPPERWTIDLTRWQYGWPELTMPLDQYCRRKTRSDAGSELQVAFGFQKARVLREQGDTLAPQGFVQVAEELVDLEVQAKAKSILGLEAAGESEGQQVAMAQLRTLASSKIEAAVEKWHHEKRFAIRQVYKESGRS